MSRICLVCSHPDRPALDAAILSGAPKRGIARRAALSPDAVERHAKTHLPAVLVKAAERRNENLGDGLLDQMKSLRARTLSLLDDAEESRDIRLRGAAVHQIRENLALEAKLLADAAPKTTEADVERLLAWYAEEAGVTVDEMRFETEKAARISADLVAGRHVPHTPPPAPVTQPWMLPAAPPAVAAVAVPETPKPDADVPVLRDVPIERPRWKMTI